MGVSLRVADVPVPEHAAIRILNQGIHLGLVNVKIHRQHPSGPVRCGGPQVIPPFLVRLAGNEGVEQSPGKFGMGSDGCEAAQHIGLHGCVHPLVDDRVQPGSVPVQPSHDFVHCICTDEPARTSATSLTQ